MNQDSNSEQSKRIQFPVYDTVGQALEALNKERGKEAVVGYRYNGGIGIIQSHLDEKFKKIHE